MTAYQVYEQAIKPLSTEEKLAIARLIMEDVVPEVGPHTNQAGLNALLPRSGSEPAVKARPPREFGAGQHLLSGAGIDVDELMAVNIDDMFADYMPENV